MVAARHLALAMVLAVTASCGVDSGDGPGDVGSIGSLIELVADTDANRSLIVMVDYERARQLSGVDQPPTDASADSPAVKAMFEAFAPGDRRRQPDDSDPVLVSSPHFFRSGRQLDEFRRSVGFSLLDADQEVFAGRLPVTLTVVVGRIDSDRVADAVRTDEEWSDDLERAEHEGDEYYRWGDDLSPNPGRISAVRPLGIGGRLGVDDGIARWSNDTEPLTDSFDAEADRTDSLADDDDFAAAAEALDPEQPVTAFLTADGAGFGPDAIRGSQLDPSQREEIEEQLGPAEDLPEWEVAGVADGAGADGQPRVVLVFVHADDDGADSHVSTLTEQLESGTDPATGRPWTDVFAVERIEADGRVVTAVLETEAAGLASVLFQRRSPLLVHR